MKKHLLEFFWSHYGQAIFYFLMGLLFAFIFSNTALSPDESVEYDVPADPVSESRG